MRMTPAIFLWTAVAYMLGCINGAYYLHRLRTGSDIRAAGTGNAGARNAGRVMGKNAALLVFLVDAGKGAVAGWGALAMGLGVRAAMFAGVAAVAGHIFPAQLGFRGGKGIATTFGVAFVVDPPLALAGLGVAVLSVIILRRPALSGALAVLASPVLGVIMHRHVDIIWGLSAIALLVLFAHRADLQVLMADRIELGARKQ